MQYQETPQGLAQLYSPDMPVSGAGQAMDLLTTQQNADRMTAQDQQRELDYNTAADPLRLNSLDLANQTSVARLPGIQAESSMQQRKNSNEGITNDATIKDIMGKYSSAELARHVTDTENVGSQLSQLGALTDQMDPATAHARVKQELEAMGHGDLYDSAFANTDPGALGTKLRDMGGAITSEATKYKNAMALAEAKSQAALGVAGINAGAKTDVANIGAGSKERIAAAQGVVKEHVAQLKQQLENQIVTLTNQAASEPDPAKKAALLQQAQKATAIKGWLLSQAAAEAGGKAVDVAGMTNNEIPVRRPPTPTAPPIAGIPGAQGGPDVGQGGPLPGSDAPPPMSPFAEPQAPAPKAAPMPMPRVGDVYKGHKFTGGDPANKNSWQKVE
jgi:hypothetical protein